MNTDRSTSFLARHEFLIRRLHSLSGLIPVGAYMVVHLVTNASVLNGPGSFQRLVYQIHSLDSALWVVEWTFIFIPILFHAILGVVIIRGGLPNSGTYTYVGNIRYTLQRVTGMIAFLFIMGHVFHMHGWFHFEWWTRNVAEPLWGSQFKAYNAASSAGTAIQASLLVQLAYLVGTLSCVYHLANGLWTMGITWGVWTSPAGQRKADIVCGVFGVALTMVSLGALWGMRTVDVKDAYQIEDRMYHMKTSSGEIRPNEHKRASPDESPLERTVKRRDGSSL